jgi:putative hydrolase of HD superfamily
MSTSEFLNKSSLGNMSSRMQQQIGFILEMDKLKKIIRRSPLLDNSRRENDAEHSWHLAMLAMVLGEYAKPEVNMNRVIRLLLVHDIVEIDAGDTFLYDQVNNESKTEREMQAAKRIYGLLPEDTSAELFALWQEFEARETPDAIFASALDRLQPMLHNYFSGGGTWVEYKLSFEQVSSRKKMIQDASEELWAFTEKMIQDAKARGYLS